MSKKSFLMVLVAIAAICAFTFVGLTHTEVNQNPQVSPGVQRASDLPEHVPYMFLFQHLHDLRNQADKHRRLGKDGSGFQRRFKNVLVVDDDQFDKINEVALQCESEVEELDGKAKAITEAFRAQYPPGKVPAGVIIPPPPAELTVLQEMRNSAVLRARDHMRLVLGEQEFARFDEIVKARLTPGIKRVSNQ